MLELLRKDLEEQGVFNTAMPSILADIVTSINNNKIPYRMKMSIAVSELVLFASHLRRNIAHWNGSSIPINAITFSIAVSGAGKDSSVTAARKCFKPAYDELEKKRKAIAVQQAIRRAKADGRENPDDYGTYKNYYNSPNPLFVQPSTTEGFTQHLNDLETAGTGAGFIFSGEFGAELANSTLLVDNIKLLAEVYDEGSKEVKVLKNRENQSKAIKNLPVSALFVGSQDNLLYDDSVKRKFKTEFSTKLARRSFFNYNPETVESKQYSSVDEMLREEKAMELAAVSSRNKAAALISEIAQYNLNGIGQPLPIDEEVMELFIKYKRYNEELAETVKAQFPIAKLTRQHLQWKALKLAGAIAIFNANDSITEEDYKAAVSYCEMLNNDMEMFEAELIKEPYEIFVDFMNANAEDGKYFISLHALRKLGYIPTSGTPLTKMKELVHLASSLDKLGVYTVSEEGINFEKQVLTEITHLSYKSVTGTKEQRMRQCADNFESYETTFEELAVMLTEDLAYSPFLFKDGVRGKDNITSGCKWLVLDVDNSVLTDRECHFMLSDINHHIARTSDNENEFKFRVLLELDSIVDIPDLQWKYFLESVTNELAIKADILPKSQIFFSYKGREVLSNLDASPLEAKSHIMKSAEALSDKQQSSPKKLSSAQQQALLDDKFTTFHYAFDCENGTGSRSLIRAAYHAKDLGASLEEIIELVKEINRYWSDPMEEYRLQTTIISQIERW